MKTYILTLTGEIYRRYRIHASGIVDVLSATKLSGVFFVAEAECLSANPHKYTSLIITGPFVIEEE